MGTVQQKEVRSSFTSLIEQKEFAVSFRAARAQMQDRTATGMNYY